MALTFSPELEIERLG